MNYFDFDYLTTIPLGMFLLGLDHRFIPLILVDDFALGLTLVLNLLTFFLESFVVLVGFSVFLLENLGDDGVLDDALVMGLDGLADAVEVDL